MPFYTCLFFLVIQGLGLGMTVAEQRWGAACVVALCMLCTWQAYSTFEEITHRKDE